jgi:hypothetical protein
MQNNHAIIIELPLMCNFVIELWFTLTFNNLCNINCLIILRL